MAKTAPLSHRLDPELKRKLQRLADADRRSLTNYVELVLERHVATMERGGGDGRESQASGAAR